MSSPAAGRTHVPSPSTFYRSNLTVSLQNAIDLKSDPGLDPFCTAEIPFAAVASQRQQCSLRTRFMACSSVHRWQRRSLSTRAGPVPRRVPAPENEGKTREARGRVEVVVEWKAVPSPRPWWTAPPTALQDAPVVLGLWDSALEKVMGWQLMERRIQGPAFTRSWPDEVS